MKKAELQLLPHDPAWIEDFVFEKNRIADVLPGVSVQIEHVGSTSIPTVHAKPILDIAILCDKSAIDTLARALTELGYDFRGAYDDKTSHFYAVLDKDDARLCQVHIYTEANSDWNRKLRFRDVLRQNLELAQEYDAYKLNLAKTTNDKTEYARVKSGWVDDFILKVLNIADNEV